MISDPFFRVHQIADEINDDPDPTTEQLLFGGILLFALGAQKLGTHRLLELLNRMAEVAQTWEEAR